MKQITHLSLVIFMMTLTSIGFSIDLKAAGGKLDLSLPDDYVGSYYNEVSDPVTLDFTGSILEDKVTDYGNHVAVLGMDSETVLRVSGVKDGRLDNDSPCSSSHDRGDFANQWCHAYFSKLAHRILKNAGYSEWAAQAAGISVFLIKESADKNFDWSDVTTAPIAPFGGALSKKSRAFITFALDGSYYIEYQHLLD